jgi:hypothetical protein
MSTATFDVDSVSDADNVVQYRALHTGALIGLVLGLASFCTLITAASSLEYCLLVTPIPLMGIVVSLQALSRIRQDSDQYTGRPLAMMGLVLSLVFLVSGLSYGGYVYATEVPEGYTRISFNGMKPTKSQEQSGTVVPPEIMALDGQRVFIKGYMRQDSIKVSKGISDFLLVRDNNECCFGDLSKIRYYDMIDVDMTGPNTVSYSQGIFRMGGILKINPKNVLRGPQYPVFTLAADYAK